MSSRSVVTDTQGIAVLEAMACGLPSVAARSAAVAGVLRHEREGLIVDPEPAAFAAALQSLLENTLECSAMGARARHRAVEFSAAACAERVVAVYARARADRESTRAAATEQLPCEQGTGRAK